jgi:hypothetical protein
MGLSVSFSQVTYAKIAKFVGLEPDRRLKDIQTFELHRSCIPTALFKSIVQDMDMMMVQHGPLPDHDHEEATSRFLSPVRFIQRLDCDKRTLLPTDLQPSCGRVWLCFQEPTGVYHQRSHLHERTDNVLLQGLWFYLHSYCGSQAESWLGDRAFGCDCSSNSGM